MILMNDFKRMWAEGGERLTSAVARVGESGWYILGHEVATFEKSLSAYAQVSNSVGVANGMDALEIALRALDLKAGDKVLTTPLSAFPTTLAIIRCGGVPIFCDVDERGLLDLQRAAKILAGDKSIKFMIPVHLYGFCLDLDGLESLRSRFDLKIVEDCAQSLGSSWNGRACGSVGQMAATSFYPTKNLGCIGDGGAILTENSELAARARILRDYGQSAKYIHTTIGLNSRLDEIQAAMMNSYMLPNLPNWTIRRREIAQRYSKEIKNDRLQIVKDEAASSSVWHLYPILVKENRDQLQAHLASRNVQSGVHYPALISEQKALEDLPYETVGELETARKWSMQELSLPIHPLLTDEEVSAVIQAANEWNG